MAKPPVIIPETLRPYFQEFDTDSLNTRRDANTIIQRTLEFGDWEELRWLFRAYTKQRVRRFLREHGERWLSPVAFNYWRRLIRLRRWQSTVFDKGDLWNR